MKIVTKGLLVALLFLFITDSVWSSNQEKEIQGLAKMNLQELTARAMALVAKKYPGETWKSYHFPKFVYINDSVLIAYKIAVKETRLVAHFSCYCFCEEMGHKNLSYCFLKKGTLGTVDNHAANCNVCDAQTMHAFLLNELGVPVDRIKTEMKKIYAGH
jgi:transcription elongation factor Elf1